MQPYLEKHEHVRGGVRRFACRGRNAKGYPIQYIEYADPHPDFPELILRKVPTGGALGGVLLPIDEYGVSQPAITQWRKGLYTQAGKFVRWLSDELDEMTTNDPDMYLFSGLYGMSINYSLFNGEIRAIEGHDAQPLFLPNAQGQLERVPDEAYDTDAPPTWTYYTHTLPETTLDEPSKPA